MLMECEGFWPTVSSILGWVLATYSGFLLGRFWPTLSVSGNGFKDAVNTPYDSSQGRQAAPQRGNSPQPGASDRRERHPGLSRHPALSPQRGKSLCESVRDRTNYSVIKRMHWLQSLLLPLWGDKAGCRGTPGCRSLRSLALGWVLTTPSGFCPERFLLTASFIPGGDGWLSIGVSLERFLPTDYITLIQVSQV